MKGDFHMHTTYSDGALSVAEVLAIASNLDFISITDHDFLQGSLDAIKQNKKKPKIIIGVELSTEYKNESVHILGYFNNESNMQELNQLLQLQRNHRLKRAHFIGEKLKQHFNIDLNMDFTKNIHSVTRGTIAQEIVAQGYPYSREEIFSKLIGRGCPAYLPSTKVTSKEGIALIHQFGGLAVLAHPTLLKEVKAEEIISLGIDGLEAIYSQNKEHDEAKYTELAIKNHLFITAGSDFHRFDDYKHGDIGSVVLEGPYLQTFLEKCGIKI